MTWYGEPPRSTGWNTMTVGRLIELLEDIRDDHPGGEKIVVRLMHQPHWPFEYSISDLVLNTDIGQDAECEDCGYAVYACTCEDKDPDNDVPKDWPRDDNGNPIPVVYLTEGTQLGYGTKAAWDAGRM